jgi:hypothetical protein
MVKQLKKLPFVLIAGVCLWLNTGCQLNDEAVAATIEQQVSHRLQEMASAWPTSTHQPTLTPQPSFTIQPTYTAWPSFTPNATYTLQPTYTAAPTLTPIPTDTPTPTVVPTNTPIRAVVTAPPTQPAVNVAAALLQKINITITQLEDFRSSIPPICRGVPLSCDYVVNCPLIVSQYDTITAPYPLNTAGSSAVVQNAYGGYQTGVNLFADNLRSWVSTCREAISNGETVTSDQNNRNVLYISTFGYLMV